MHAGHHYTDSTVSEASAPPLPPPPPPFPLDSYEYTTATAPTTTRFPVSTSNHQDGINHYPEIPPPPPPMPPPMPPPIVVNSPSSPQPWSTGLCDCFTDCRSCCLTFWCPCVTFGRIAEIVDRGSNACGVSGMIYGVILCLTGWSCLYSCFYRSKLRGQFFLEESPCVDCCVHCWCEGCALCQEYRELQNRGFDLSIGWHGNMERQRREGGGHVNPVMPHQGMTRDR